jgi:hypothetical protein
MRSRARYADVDVDVDAEESATGMETRADRRGSKEDSRSWNSNSNSNSNSGGGGGGGGARTRTAYGPLSSTEQLEPLSVDHGPGSGSGPESVLTHTRTKTAGSRLSAKDGAEVGVAGARDVEMTPSADLWGSAAPGTVDNDGGGGDDNDEDSGDDSNAMDGQTGANSGSDQHQHQQRQQSLCSSFGGCACPCACLPPSEIDSMYDCPTREDENRARKRGRETARQLRALLREFREGSAISASYGSSGTGTGAV